MKFVDHDFLIIVSRQM